MTGVKTRVKKCVKLTTLFFYVIFFLSGLVMVCSDSEVDEVKLSRGKRKRLVKKKLWRIKQTTIEKLKEQHEEKRKEDVGLFHFIKLKIILFGFHRFSSP